MNFRLYLTFAFLFFGYSLNAQEAIWFDHLGVQKGLSQNSVLDIAEDKEGFMWIGTRHGLNRYDGYSFKVYLYNEQDSTSVINNYIYDLLVDSHQKLWVATSTGISIYQKETDNFKHTVAGSGKSGLTAAIVRCLYEDRDGNIWAGTVNGLNLINQGNTKDITHLFHVDKSLGKGKTILSIVQDKEGAMWIGTTSGLIRLRKDKNGWTKQVFSHSDKTGSISDNYITSLITDKNGNLWVGTLSGLNLFNHDNETFKHFKHRKEDKNSLIHNSIRKIEFDINGKMWIGTLGGISILDIDLQTFRNVQSEPGKPHSLNQNSVYAVYKDSNGSMWVGTYFGGININYPYTTRFNIVQKSSDGKGISNNVVSGFAEDAAGSFWVGTEGGGINRRLKGDTKYVSFNNSAEKFSGPTSNLIKMLLVDKEDNLWAGTHAGGLNRYKPETNKFEAYYFNSEKDEFPDEITALTEDALGSIWVATQRNGLWQFNKEQQSFNKPLNPALNKELAKIQTRCLYFSKEGTLYIGTTSGLIIYDKKKNQTYRLSKATEPGKLLPYYINCIAETRNGSLFLGTDYGGLLWYDRKNNRVTTFTTENGLPHNTILGILEDEHGFLWISTANGLSRMDPGKQIFKNYTVADGLPSNEFNRNAYYRGKNGDFYFGGYNGFISFRPQHIQSNKKRAPIVLTDIQVDRKSVKINDEDGILKQSVTYSKKIKLKYVQNTFSLHFALLNFVKPEKNKYQYMLEGFEKNWIKTNVPNASYTNLPPGTYLFKVRGVNNDGWSSSNTIELPIVIRPPFYFTWWAYTIYLIFFIGVLILLFRYFFIRERLRSEKESNARKLEFFTHISHEIRTPLTLILTPLEQLLRNDNNVPPSTLQVLRSIQSNANRLVLLVTELLDFRKADAGLMQLYVDTSDIVAFSKKIFEAFQDLAESRNIDFRFQAVPERIVACFDSQQLEKVLYNLLSNAFKFTANQGQIVVQLEELESSICITVTDNGKGIPQSRQKNLFTNFYQANPGVDIGTGLGLSLSKKILDLHHAQINIESNMETSDMKGFTKVTVSLLKGNKHFEATSITTLDSNRTSNIYQTMAQPTVRVNSQELNGNRRYTILITEDNLEVSDMIHNILAPDYFILEAGNGQEGFEKAVTHIPDLVISDVTMPIVDGFEFCHHLKTDPRTSHIPVILLTARSAHVHHINGLEQGADVYLTKPFDARILELHIQNALSIREAIKLKLLVTLPSQVNQFGNQTEQMFTEKVIKLIDTHLSDQTFGVSELASGVGMSNPVLYKKIRALTGLSVNEFIKHIRLQTAAALLRDSKVNITEVAYAVGFSSRKYFSLEFKKAFNKSPSEFRESIETENEI